MIAAFDRKFRKALWLLMIPDPIKERSYCSCQENDGSNDGVPQGREKYFHRDSNQSKQGCIFRLTCSHPELTEDHVLTSAYVNFFRTATRNAKNKSV